MHTFHEGEVAMQRDAGAGVAQRLADAGPRVIRDHMPQQHRDFFALLPFLLAGTLDAQGWPIASILAGPEGFVQSPRARALRIAAQPAPGDPREAGLRAGEPVGLLGLQPHTRRRNRMNGHVSEADATGVTVAVGQSFGNCPKYIQARAVAHRPGAAPAEVRAFAGLDAAAARLVREADTFFIASAHPAAAREGGQGAPAEGVDVSHRGGRPGFVQVEGDTLTVPDFLGNFFFNTLGNLRVEPRCGLLFIAAGGGERLYLRARARIVAEGDALARFAGAQRLLQLAVEGGRHVRGGLPLHWGAVDEPSPQLAGTGRWD